MQLEDCPFMYIKCHNIGLPNHNIQACSSMFYKGLLMLRLIGKTPMKIDVTKYFKKTNFLKKEAEIYTILICCTALQLLKKVD